MAGASVEGSPAVGFGVARKEPAKGFPKLLPNPGRGPTGSCFTVGAGLTGGWVDGALVTGASVDGALDTGACVAGAVVEGAPAVGFGVALNELAKGLPTLPKPGRRSVSSSRPDVLSSTRLHCNNRYLSLIVGCASTSKYITTCIDCSHCTCISTDTSFVHIVRQLDAAVASS